MPNATKRIIIMGAAGRDFHNFNVAYRDDPTTEVVAFTAAQIPGIGDRRYPTELAGSRYPNGIPILSEIKLAELVTQEQIDQVVFAYSDVTHLHVMHQASIVLAAGADFALLGPHRTMLTSRLPVISVCAVRTGGGSRRLGGPTGYYRIEYQLLAQSGNRRASNKVRARVMAARIRVPRNLICA